MSVDAISRLLFTNITLVCAGECDTRAEEPTWRCQQENGFNECVCRRSWTDTLLTNLLPAGIVVRLRDTFKIPKDFTHVFSLNYPILFYLCIQ